MERTRIMEALTEGRTGGRTDTQNFGRFNLIPSLLFVAGNKKRLNKGPLDIRNKSKTDKSSSFLIDCGLMRNN